MLDLLRTILSVSEVVDKARARRKRKQQGIRIHIPIVLGCPNRECDDGGLTLDEEGCLTACPECGYDEMEGEQLLGREYDDD